ncbi:MAG TPA: peptidyl-prolyl cis-trans isomerase [Desulfuromonadaceae bacterium]|jgi:parvulin-like peptidyl-prolyl isomerase
MKLRMIARIAVIVFTCAAPLTAGAVENSTAQPPASPKAAVQPNPPPNATDAPAEKKPQSEEVTLRLQAPVFSPLFAKVPLALVNDEPITMEDLKKSLGTIHEGMAEGKPVPKQNFPELLKRLVNAQLIIQEGRNMELDKQEEIKPAIDDYSQKLLRETLLKEQVKNVKADEKEVEKLYLQRTSEWRLKSLIIDKLEDVKAFEADLKAGKRFDDLYNAYIKAGRAKEGGKTEDFLSRDVIPPAMLKTLEKIKVGETSKALPLEKGYLFYRVEEVRHKEDPAIKEQVRQELDTKARLASLEGFQDSLIKKYFSQDKKQKKLLDTLDFENKKVKYETFLKDKRVIGEIKGQKPVTVADLAEAIALKYYHGVERAAEGKKINKEKKAILNDHLGTIVINKEAKARKIDESEEYRTKVRAFSNSLLFGTFVTKIIRPEITVTQDELQAYYKEHSKEYTTLEAYKLDAIAFDPPEKAEEAVDKLRKGTEFKWLKANAEGRTSISKSLYNLFEGEPIVKLNLPESLQKALAGAKTGDYRVFTDGKLGYAIAVIAYEPVRTKTYPEVEEAIKEAVFYEKLNKGIEEWANKLKGSSNVVIYADFGQSK